MRSYRGVSAPGFTLIEVIVTALIVTVGVVSILEGMNLVAVAAARHSRWTRATLVGKEAMDRLLLDTSISAGFTDEKMVTTAEGTFRCETEVVDYRPQFQFQKGSLLECRVTVEWDDSKGKEGQINLTSLEFRENQ